MDAEANGQETQCLSRRSVRTNSYQYLEAQLGTPVEFFEDLNIACYRLNRVSRRRLWLFPGVLPIAAPRDADRTEVALVHFDDAGLIHRQGLLETWGRATVSGGEL